MIADSSMMGMMMWERRLDPIGHFSTHSDVRLHLVWALWDWDGVVEGLVAN